jgi:hypothetical protein
MVTNEVKPSHFPGFKRFVANPVLADFLHEEINAETEMATGKACFDLLYLFPNPFSHIRAEAIEIPVPGISQLD